MFLDKLNIFTSEFEKVITLISQSQIQEEQHQKIVKEVLPYRGVPIPSNTSNYRSAGVLIALYPHNDEIHFSLIKRPSYEGHHGNQISFPGGKRELEDKDIIETAIREANEEVNIDPLKLQIIKVLNQIYIPPSNFMVTPVVAYLNERPEFIPEKKEVESILEIPLASLCLSENIKNESVTINGSQQIITPCFVFNNHIVWGATCAILNELKHILIRSY